MNDRIPSSAPGPGRPLAYLALALGVVAILLVGLAGPGTRIGWWDFRMGFTLMKYGAYAGIAAVIVAVVAVLVARRAPGPSAVRLALFALVLGGAAWFLPWNWRRHAAHVPPIHDITTDFANPPQLTFSRAMRDTSGGKLNAWQYEGDSIAKLQQKAYPDIRPLMLAMPPDQAYRAAARAAQEMGWAIEVNDPQGHTLEAVDETPWFGFKDDVAVRVTPASGISRVDVRSVSRVGRSDLGMNAARIRKYLARLREDNKGKVAQAG